MKALVIGAGGVGSAIANIASRRPFISSMVVADRNLSRAQEAVTKVNDPRFSAEEVDASDVKSIRALIRKAAPDIVVNAVDPRFVMPIFLACEEEKLITWIWRCHFQSHTQPIQPISLASKLAMSNLHAHPTGRRVEYMH
jgi:phosphoribosylamine-glycine ligase